MKQFLLGFVLLLACISAGAVIWTGSTSNDWSVASNWSSGSVPTSSTDVVIPERNPGRHLQWQVKHQPGKNLYGEWISYLGQRIHSEFYSCFSPGNLLQ